MNKTPRELWIEALESGEYKQTKGNLRNGDSYCCLGVLCDVYRKNVEGSPDWHAYPEGYSTYFNSFMSVPVPVAEWLMGHTWHNSILVNAKGIGIIGLSSLNDSYAYTFVQIAECLRNTDLDERCFLCTTNSAAASIEYPSGTFRFTCKECMSRVVQQTVTVSTEGNDETKL